MKSQSVQLTHTAHHSNLASRWISVTLSRNCLKSGNMNTLVMEDKKVKLVFWFCFEDAIWRKWEGVSSGSLEVRPSKIAGQKVLSFGECGSGGQESTCSVVELGLIYSIILSGTQLWAGRKHPFQDCRAEVTVFKRTQGSSEPHKALPKQRNGETLKGLHRVLN